MMTVFKCAAAPPTGLFRLTASKSTTLPSLNGISSHADEHAAAQVRDRPAFDPRIEDDALGVHLGGRLAGRGPWGDLVRPAPRSAPEPRSEAVPVGVGVGALRSRHGERRLTPGSRLVVLVR